MKYNILILFSFLTYLTAVGQGFTLVTGDPSTITTARSYGVAMVDVDLDGDLDIYSTSVFNVDNECFLNNGNGNFTPSGSSPLVIDGNYTYGTSWGDYDNDGDLDCFIANRDQDNRLYRNDEGTFTEITTGHIVNDSGNSRSGVWADYDNDGCLDLYVTNQSQSVNFLYRGLCNGTFERIMTGDIVTHTHNSYGCSWTDMDKDGDVDLLVLNTQGNNDLYENNGDGTFTTNTTSSLTMNGNGEWNHGAAWGDYDNDLDLDLYISNVSGANYLFRNDGDFNFTEIVVGEAVSDVGETTGNVWFDMDNDGDQDLMATNRLGANNRLYENNGFGTLTSVSSNITVGGDSRGVAIGDLNGDGAQDIYVANEFENNFLYLNNDTQNYWFSLVLVGTVSNKAAIGAKVSVQANIWDKHIWQYQEITTQTGYLSQGSISADFGMGDAWVADTIIIEWPSGLVCQLVDIPANQQITVIENCNVTAIENQTFSSMTGLKLYPVPTKGSIKYSFITQSDFTLELFDLMGKLRVRKKLMVGNTGWYDGRFELPKDFSNGIYTLRFTDDVRSVSKRIILSK